MNSVCKNCDLGLQPKDCSEHEQIECQFEDILWKFAGRFGVQAVIEKLDINLDDFERKKAIKYLLDKIK